jgi:thiol-disulfide isomerase/thioredoxin
MKALLSIVAGLVVGVAVAGLVLGGLVALAPDPTVPATPTPSIAIATPGPSAAASASASATPSASAATSAGSSYIGQPAPPLVVPQVGGGTIDLASLRGVPVWIDFMTTRCPSCKDEFPLMNGYAARYADSGLVVIAIDVKEPEDAVAAFAESLGASFPVGLDSDGAAASAWDAAALPAHFWIDAQGVVRDAALGGIGPDVMERGLASILPGVDVTP